MRAPNGISNDQIHPRQPAGSQNRSPRQHGEYRGRDGQGHRIDVLPVPPAMLAPEIFPERKWLLVTTGKVTAARKKQIELWQQQVVSLDVIPL